MIAEYAYAGLKVSGLLAGVLSLFTALAAAQDSTPSGGGVRDVPSGGAAQDSPSGGGVQDVPSHDAAQDSPPAAGATRSAAIFDIPVRTMAGVDTTLGAYRGSVLLIVNVASKCGFTPQYEELQALYERFDEQGLLVLGFPANNFLNQEPGTNQEITEFCRVNYGVTFPMFEKISVKGEDQHPLYAYLTSKQTNPEHGGEIGWNFDKFLIARDGRVADRFGTRTKPLDARVVAAIEKELAAK